MCVCVCIYIHTHTHTYECVYVCLLRTLHITHILHVTALHFNKYSRLPSSAVCDTPYLGNDKTSKQFVGRKILLFLIFMKTVQWLLSRMRTNGREESAVDCPQKCEHGYKRMRCSLKESPRTVLALYIRT